MHLKRIVQGNQFRRHWTNEFAPKQNNNWLIEAISLCACNMMFHSLSNNDNNKNNNFEPQSWNGPYGSSSPGPLREAPWGIKLLTSGSAARDLNHWTLQQFWSCTTAVIQDNTVMLAVDCSQAEQPSCPVLLPCSPHPIQSTSCPTMLYCVTSAVDQEEIIYIQA